MYDEAIPEDFSEDDIRRIVETRVPSWKNTCANKDAGVIVLSQAAFGETSSKIFLMALAVKYAGMHQKNVMIIPSDLQEASSSL